MIKKILLLGAGGFIGSNLRYFTSLAMHSWFKTNFPIGTLSVNVLGSFILGFVFSLTISGKHLSPDMRLFIGTGLIGALTTFSTFSYETLELLKGHSLRLALYNVFFNLIIGFGACLLGMYSASRL